MIKQVFSEVVLQNSRPKERPRLSVPVRGASNAGKGQEMELGFCGREWAGEERERENEWAGEGGATRLTRRP